jgi:hypothetical protein
MNPAPICDVVVHAADVRLIAAAAHASESSSSSVCAGHVE